MKKKKELSEEHKRKIGDSHKGKRLSEISKKRLSESKKKMATEGKLKGLFKKGHKTNLGKRWGKNPESINRRFGGMREFIFERDNYECLHCGMSQEQHILLFNRSLTIDHIDGQGRNSDNPNNSPENLQTLCLRCHGKKDILNRKWRKMKGGNKVQEWKK